MVDDDPSTANVIADELEYRGFETEVAWNGARALERLADNIRPSVIVLDMMMPVLSGWQFIKRYKNLTGGPAIPIVALSATGSIPDATHDHGIRSFIPKPFDLTQIVVAVREAVLEH